MGPIQLVNSAQAASRANREARIAARHAFQPVRDRLKFSATHCRHVLQVQPSLRRDTAPAAARTTALPAKVSPRSPEELIWLLKRLPNSVSREESTSDVSVRFYQGRLRWDLDEIRETSLPHESCSIRPTRR